jgi:hypothetical protein
MPRSAVDFRGWIRARRGPMSATDAGSPTSDPITARRDALRERLNQAMTGAL